MSASIVRAAVPPLPTVDPGLVPTSVLTAIGTGVSSIGDVFELASRSLQNDATHQSIMASHLRRRDEWAFQSNMTLKELRQIDQQLLANQIKVEIARKEKENQQVQIEQAHAVDAYLRDKYTNAQLYDWMVSQLATVHWSAYQMALDLARRAERASQRELGTRPTNLIRNDYWNALRAGLLAGERLHQDIKRLEIAHVDQNRREHELIKHVSLSRLNPVELNKLKTTGVCDVKIPEWLFDMDMPGHYMRRIKTVSVSIPCVVGPYASVNCKLTLLKNVIRHSPSSDGTYPMRPTGDADRFSVNFGASESIVTSTGRDDSGLFETALRDERYLPFESAGAISDWRVEIPGKPRQFDFDTINDVILHIRYTARDGGEDLRDAALEQFAAQSPIRHTSFPQFLLSTRSDFANDWAAAQASSTRLKVKLSLDLLPYWMQALGLVIRGISTIPWVKDSTENPQPTKVWSAVPPLSQAGIDGNGVGVADLGPIETGVDDVLILLDVGRV
jgi:Tc toxin complex TcA C-terminal TcB-binding domain